MIHNSMQNAFILVLFGATGDLARNKLLPALFALFTKKQLPNDFSIFGFARRDMTSEEFRKFFPEISTHPAWADFAQHLFYQQGLFDEKSGYQELKEKLQKYNATITRIFYLATPPQNYDAILQHIVLANFTKENVRIAIEKPFGKDLQTARELDKKLANTFEEKQIFRVDHYLGKETVQNLLVFRFANGIFDPIWNNHYIDHVQITLSEEKGVGSRGAFFDGVGALQDFAQNHIMQLFAAVAMEMPRSFSKEGVRDVRSQAIKDLIPIEPSEVSTQVVRGQYIGYLKEKDVSPNSTTETFVAMKFFVKSERFRDVPFYVRVGKLIP